ECEPGDEEESLCGCGARTVRACDEQGQWGAWSDDCAQLCDGVLECEQGMTERQECGTCGTQARSCERGTGSAWSAGEEPMQGCGQPTECSPRDTQRRACAQVCM
ncbi:MAG: hypothetical protein AAFX99_37170, partial [Myxococcota bacterium]